MNCFPNKYIKFIIYSYSFSRILNFYRLAELSVAINIPSYQAMRPGL